MKLTHPIMVIFILVILITGGFSFWLYNALHSPISHNCATKYITIEQGSSSNRILEVLERNKILQAPLATKIYLRFSKMDDKMEAGDYKFPSPISPIDVINQLKQGKKRTKTLTIPEGWTRFEIAKRIVKEFPVESLLTEKEVLSLMDDTRLIQEIDSKAKNLEGYLYPTTYEFKYGTHPKDVIAKMVQQFKSVWQTEWGGLAQEMGRTKREIIIIASLIENESKIDAERGLVASVIYNRLESKIPLGIDATNVYIAKLLGRWDGIIHKSDLEVNHPYNTRKVLGLPPGPISSPSKTAIEAALNPEQTENLYYVLNVEANDGSHHFYPSATEFSKGKADYQKWLANQRRN
ncbi:endolytic transglycosylase MltG [Aquimarina sp. AD10]|uniref:endolytic transglycosylase MltG n=1 Tax=Aquimarina sp. AD10 TaxID=1714849 RepID=UPI000E50F0B9|nr:endolytic transglycosylase MltG [Aquimarina sp. AD10]AXT59210.1 endolytic transglycosylase MltG [Aquimarina sp. AD10]RKM92700.1 endolytic transglycosylase MltG [Aquimarina sp. AD10]